MRARNKVGGALAIAIGVAIAVTTAISPASARPAPPVTSSSYSCASFEGLTVTAPSVSYSGVGMHTGEVITVTVSPAAAGDNIGVFASMGFSFVYGGGPATQPYAFKSPYDTVYNLSWSYGLADNSTSTINRTWKFDCSSASVPAPPTQPTPTPTSTPLPPKHHGKR